MSVRSALRNRRSINYQTLENRLLLAGDVTVVEDGHLFIRGDGADNQFEVVADNGQLEVRGLGGTTINGLESYVVAGAEVTESGVTFAGGLRAHLGPGNDDFAVRDAVFESQSLVYGGTGDDNVDVTDSTFHGQFTIQTYDGDDSVSTTRSHFSDTLYAITLDGQDSVTVVDSIFAYNSIVNTGDHSDSIYSEGNHYLGEVNLLLSFAGDDTVELNNPVVGEDQLGVFLGSGDDTINADLAEASIASTIRIGGQTGVDQAPEITTNEQAQERVSMATIEHQQVFDGGVGGAAGIESGVDAFLFEDTNDGNRYATPIVLDSTQTITSIEWTGVYNRDVFAFLSETTPPDLGDNFVIEIFEGAEDGAPDSSTAVRFEVGGANRADSGETRAVTRSGEVIDEYSVFEFSADVEFTFEAGQEYWVSIYTVFEEAQLGQGNLWSWGSRFSSSINETVYRLTHTPDSATRGDNDWRFGAENERQPDIQYGIDLDIRLRT